MKIYSNNLEEQTLANTNFRQVLHTDLHSQLVLMSLLPQEEIGMETHPDNDQFIRFEKGEGNCIINGNVYPVSDGFAIIIPAGAEHNIINISNINPLKLYTIYSPPHHKDGTIHTAKKDAKSES